ncbi:MAG: hypothetical protein LBU32_22470 [Clostridiales bacterium]|nr:hypothetical protein [Clostridiales bacterium]
MSKLKATGFKVLQEKDAIAINGGAQLGYKYMTCGTYYMSKATTIIQGYKVLVNRLVKLG